ncbi:MAG TPA: class I SAM-dependent methyltransferase, partial [Pseudonocardiaceae bacterium]|nr:class I SAM-dependent methyltransferase [Pseudonocardiaceae bacterium]
MPDTREHSTGIAAGVGRTALMVAAARAMETHRPDSLARDEFAEHFVRAAAVSVDWPVRIEESPGGDAN